jgi:hypothetical protein
LPLTISTRSIGRRKPVLGDFDVPPPPDLRDDGELLLRDLIEHVVRCQVRQFNQRQNDRRFDRVLSAQSIEQAAKAGKVDPAGRSDRTPADPDEAVGAALQAFEDGLFLVIIDEVERRSLEEPVYLSSNSRLVFLRLTFLAGA